MGNQGLLLLMELKFLKMMTRPQNLTAASPWPLILIKPGASNLWLRAPGFLKLLRFARQYVRVCVSVCVCLFMSASKGNTNQWRDIAMCDWLNKFHGFP